MDDYKEIIRQLYKELQNKFNTEVKYKENYIQFPIKSNFGTHFELWLINRDSKLYIDFHQENNVSEVNEALFEYLSTELSENDEYEIQERVKGKTKLLRQKKTYKKENILSSIDEIYKDILNIKNRFEAKIESYLKALKKFDLSSITKENIIQAIDEFDVNQQMCKGRESVNWELDYKNKKYPHKCIVGRAYNISRKEENVLNSYLYSSICNQNYCASKILKDLGFNIINIENKGKNQMPVKNNQPLNQILYGPPGTGKTYNTINKALEIVLNIDTYAKQIEEINSELVAKAKEVLEANKDKIKLTKENDERELLKQVFDFYKDEGQIEFVTFHQSYGYEEFVEGIKADLELDEIKYKVEDGIFKKLVDNAKYIKAQDNNLSFDWENGNIFKMSLGGKNDLSILEWCLENDYISMGWGNEIDFSTIESKNWDDFKVKSKELFENNKPERFTLQAMYAFKEWMKINDLVFISSGNLRIVAIGQIIGEYEYKDSIDEIRYSQFRKVKWLFVEKSGIPVEKILTKKLSQQTIYNLDKEYLKRDFFDSLFFEKKEDKIKNYILIIDEINRGNISKIFGELITLIEPSKRIGEDEEIQLKLSYSGKSFGVPSNLYIIGTMNTADRSIAQIDTALRRRFEFIEMLPNLQVLSAKDSELLESESKSNETNNNDLMVEVINIRLLLKAINERIEYIYDREHQIGHSYFMPLKNNPRKVKLDEIFRVNIIPLLAEYFYGDWADIKVILNDKENSFITEKDESELSFEITGTKRKKNKIYNVNSLEFSAEAYQNIYAKKS